MGAGREMGGGAATAPESQAFLPPLLPAGQSKVKSPRWMALASRPHADSGPRGEAVDGREWGVPPEGGPFARALPTLWGSCEALVRSSWATPRNAYTH